jgi:hypothetical protein
MAISPFPGVPSPLHPLTFALQASQGRAEQSMPSTAEAAVAASWPTVFPCVAVSPAARLLSGVPLVASPELLAEIDERVAEMHCWLTPLLNQGADGHRLPTLDVLALDLAVVAAPELARGWDLRWVEFQAFSSLLATVYGLQQAHAHLWPELAGCPAWSPVPGGSDWVSRTKGWLAPRAHSVLIEDRPQEQTTSFDFAAGETLWGYQIVDAADVRVVEGAMEHRTADGDWAPVGHASNRVILHQAESPEALSQMLERATVRWHSHPSGYYRIHKGLLPDLPLRPAERCARADNWKSLGLPPEALALKAIGSYGGADVNLHVTADALESLRHPEEWIVQPKYSPLPLFQSAAGAIFGEIRCMVLLKEGEQPWIAGRLVRLAGGEKISLGRQLGAEGEGLSVLHSPPGGAALAP